MGVGEDFRIFCSNLTVNNRETISARYRAITRRLNLDFWGSDSNTAHSIYVGSYGRGTAMRGFSDLDMIFRLPYFYYERYNQYKYNGQSALLQDVRKSVMKTYPSTYVGGDGQVVVVYFSDNMQFEVVPAFINKDGSYTYPDSNGGGRWKVTNPQPEIDAIKGIDNQCNGNLIRLCCMVRAWKNKWDVPMGGLLIDTLAYNFIRNWEYRNNSFLFYNWMSRDFFGYLAARDIDQLYWLAPGSHQMVWRKGYFQYKARRCYNLSIDAIDYQADGFSWSARQKWRQIYGSAYPS